MDGSAFDELARSLRPAASRRNAFRALTGLGLAGFVGLSGRDAAGKRRRGNNKKRHRGNPCEGEPDDASCGKGGRCFRGDCVPRPTCLGNNAECTENSECCTNACHPAYFHCVESLLGEPCYEDLDCLEGACIGYRCIQA